MAAETAPYIKQHGGNTICFADTLKQASNALKREEVKNDQKASLDEAHLMLFGVESWKDAELKDLQGAFKAPTNKFKRLEIFGCEMKEADQIAFGSILEPDQLEGITQFDLDNTVLEPKGAATIFEKICEVPTIKTLNLQGSINGKPEVMDAVAGACTIGSNLYESLSKLDLKINELKSNAAESVGAMMRGMKANDNEEKYEVDLFYNDLGADGAVHIADALKDAKSVITHLDLCCNNIGDKGALAIADMLRTNRTLVSLKLALNNIGNEGGIAICKALAPSATDENKVKNETLKLLDISANVWKEMKESEAAGAGADADAKAEARKIDELIAAVEDPDTGMAIEGSEEEYKKLLAMKENVAFSDAAKFPLAAAISRVCTISKLKEFDFTGIEFCNEAWSAVGHNLSTTSNETFYTDGEPKTIRFSIVDLMNEANLKTMESYIWGDVSAEDKGLSVRKNYRHIDWRRIDDEEKAAN